MSATVKFPSPNNTKTYDNARHATVEDGHLVLRTHETSSASVVAIFVPGSWVHVEISE